MSIFKGGAHIVTAAWQKLNTTDTQGYRQLTIRVEDNAAANVEISIDGSNQCFYLKTDESLTFGPGSGTVYASEIWLRGTAADVVYYLGTKV
jgi:hypothetical protein